MLEALSLSTRAVAVANVLMQSNEPDLDTAIQEWTEKYGSRVAEQLRVLAEENMPHCEYLMQFRV